MKEHKLNLGGLYLNSDPRSMMPAEAVTTDLRFIHDPVTLIYNQRVRSVNEDTVEGYPGGCAEFLQDVFAAGLTCSDDLGGDDTANDYCCAMCSQNVNITGYPRECVAFECTPSLADGNR